MQKRGISVSKFSSQKTSPIRICQRVFKLRTATLILLSVFVLSSIIIAGWFTGNVWINNIFAQINVWQTNPPMWIEVPKVEGAYLLLPTLGLLSTVFVVMQLSPQPRLWSRRLIVGILIFLNVRYLLWRSLSTLNLSDPLNGVISLGLLLLELLTLFNSIIQLFLMLNLKERHREANEKSLAAIANSFAPTIDILIPTFNESSFILQRTIIGCQALEYPHKKIYLLDDNKRPEIKALAEKLGCYYMTRPDNHYAKAGNLNHAIAKTSGELIVVFDADFVPTKNFLTRTIGFFQDEKIALVQTPQSFYNADPIARNLGLENVITADEEVFYRLIQPIKDAAGSVVCAGTSFVVRRSALEEIGGFVTESLSEDYFTGIRLSARGYQLIYLNEKLSAGLAAENILAYVTQRLRWAQGTLQAFFIPSNPLTIPGLSFRQRLAHLEGLLSWVSSISRLYFLFMPLVYSFFGIIPIRTSISELLYFWVPFYLVNIAVFAWLNNRSRSAFLSEIYFLIICFPLAITVIKALLNPFSKGFKVTPKGMVSNRYIYNWNLALPLMILFIATAGSLWRNLYLTIFPSSKATTIALESAQWNAGIELGWFWSAYNLIVIGVALLVLLDAPKTHIYEWFKLRRVVQLKVGEHSLWGVTTMISEVGAEVALTQKPGVYLANSQLVKMEIVEEELQLAGEIVHTGFRDEFPIVRINFESMSLSEYRRLVEILFCRPGQWKLQYVPGELRSLLLLFRILLKPRILFKRKVDVNAIAVSQL